MDSNQPVASYDDQSQNIMYAITCSNIRRKDLFAVEASKSLPKLNINPQKREQFEGVPL